MMTEEQASRLNHSNRLGEEAAFRISDVRIQAQTGSELRLRFRVEQVVESLRRQQALAEEELKQLTQGEAAYLSRKNESMTLHVAITALLIALEDNTLQEENACLS
ncbi:hypothetical protein GXP70_24690 [Paenibacillus lycopersici]|uniref:Uncharacterized protein n=1 Tax=Paenibacillus lycopersici TaxID=2704462 RepID=A0A6C0G4N5_9BACL|nr:hypothetical protein [Paenibacillus lycopersici]QHT62861.1 hypothetical protein GXP70_24690 [Paenibacillus lycopersici]